MTDIIKTGSFEILEATHRAEIDSQIATAKAYPRELTKVINDSVVIATMDKETAQTCGYALPRADKNISGPSVHLARILAAQYGNLRVESKIINRTATQITSQAVCFDLEKNYAVKVEVSKSIVGKYGKYKEDMIVVTGNAANAISFRNAVFAVIPRQVTDKVYRSTRQLITGDLSDETKLLKKRTEVIKGFKDNLGVMEDEILLALNLNTANQIKADQIVQLYGIAQAIKDGDTDVDTAFGRKRKQVKNTKDTVEDKKQAIKDKKSDTQSKMDLP